MYIGCGQQENYCIYYWHWFPTIDSNNLCIQLKEKDRHLLREREREREDGMQSLAPMHHHCHANMQDNVMYQQ